MGMMHSSSGKHGHAFHWEKTPYQFQREDLVKVLKLEDKIRASPAVQRAYSERLLGNAYLKHIRDVTLDAQRRAIRESGILKEGDRIEDVLVALHNHRVDFSNDDELRMLSVYGRYDRCWKGAIKENKMAYNAKLCDLNGYAMELRDLWSASAVPTLVIASSLS